MSTIDILTRDSVGATPAEIQLPDGLDIEVMAISATFNGASASATFLPCLALYSQAGNLIGRFFPAQPLLAGDSATVTYGPGLNEAGMAVASTIYHLVSAGSTNAAVVKSSPGKVTGYYVVNTALAFRYVKLYDKASTPTVGSDTPAYVIGVPAASAANVSLDSPAEFTTGIGIATVTGAADSSAAAVAANDLVVTLLYV